MSDEQEKLKRLRERQLAARDPLVKTRKLQQFSAERERGLDKSVSLRQAWQTIPRVWRSALWAFLLGGLTLAVLSTFLPTLWAVLGAVGLALGFLIFAIVLDNALDTRDEIKRLTK
jgi:hypothetical protein